MLDLKIFGFFFYFLAVAPDLKRRKCEHKETPFITDSINISIREAATSSMKPSSMLIIQFCMELLLNMFEISAKKRKEWLKQLTKLHRELELMPELCVRVFNECPSEDIHVYVLRVAMALMGYRLNNFKKFSKVVIEYCMEAITRSSIKLKVLQI